MKVTYGKIKKRINNKSIVVVVEKRVKHKIYNKFINKTTKILVHDENNQGNIDDVVEIKECRPISKFKSWELIRVVKF